jgi:hypothetical protein
VRAGSGPVSDVMINGPTTFAYYTKKNVGTPDISKIISLVGGASFTASQFFSGVGRILGISNVTPFTNLVAETLVGPPLSQTLAASPLSQTLAASSPSLILGCRP